ncbi:MAG: hypothetical protein M1827_004106 [Pycnora praestabilis]|nr:MAG: hypothetical protein M1827_004106 [Pycnora praestabilis]
MSAPACKDCVSGHIHAGTPTGRVTKIHGLDTYVAEPPSGTPAKAVIVFIPDAFGLPFVNNRILCDTYAKNGNFLVYLPDFMDGTACTSDILPIMDKILSPISIFSKVPLVFVAAYHFIPFLISNRKSVAYPRILSFMQALHANPPIASTPLRVGAAGFCWGGKFTVLLAGKDAPLTPTGAPLISAGYTAHPSNLSVPADLDAVNKPLSIAIGDDDMALNLEGVNKCNQILEAKTKREEGEHEVVIYDGAKHGFAVRFDEGSEKEKAQALKAEEQAVAWFQRFLV